MNPRPCLTHRRSLPHRPARRSGRTGSFLRHTLAFLLVGMSATSRAEAIPQQIPYHGHVAVGEVPFQGNGLFKFALVSPDASQTFWRNSPDTNPVDGVPDDAIAVAVDQGVFFVQLGDTSVPNMTQPIGPGVFAAGTAKLRIWFSDGTNSFSLLSPDQPFGSVPYALVAATLSNNPVLTTGGDNIAIGNPGVAGDTGTIRIGTPGTHHATYLAGAVKAERFEGDGSALTGVPGTLRSTENVVGWGDGRYGQNQGPPNLNHATAIAAGFWHCLALKPDSSVVVWGGGEFGALDMPPGLSNVVAISASQFHSVVLKQDGTVVEWGAGATDSTNIPSPAGGFVRAAAGAFFTIGIKRDGTVTVWGDNTYGQQAIPGGLDSVVEVAAGYGHCLALRQDGTVVAWGANDSSQATVPAGLTGVQAIAAGDSHSLALRKDGTIVAWGANSEGETNLPPGLTNVVAINGGRGHSIALKRDGTAVAWGFDEFGETQVPSGLSGLTAVAIGSWHALAIQPLSRVDSSLVVAGNVSAQAFLTTSDRHAKQAFSAVDPESVLTRVAGLPITEWSFQNAPGTRHLGPMAQDFRAAFGLGPDDRHIATVDADGVALAAIQGLNRKVENQTKELQLRDARIDHLEAELVELKRLVLQRAPQSIPASEETR
ncbi:MAG: hypothetical protein JNK85_04370 [Verrucomicrobiales bacterium]|nr:hypothetical protein [Verrucomicrobiales bacterium]